MRKFRILPISLVQISLTLRVSRNHQKHKHKSKSFKSPRDSSSLVITPVQFEILVTVWEPIFTLLASVMKATAEINSHNGCECCENEELAEMLYEVDRHRVATQRLYRRWVRWSMPL